MDRREHAGGVPDTERCYGVHTPVVDFDYEAIDGPTPQDMRTVEQFGDALAEICQWLVHYGRHRPHGVYVRVMALLYLLAPESIGIESQKELAKRLGVSRSWVNEVVQDFVKRYGYTALHLKLANQPRELAQKSRKRARGRAGPYPEIDIR